MPSISLPFILSVLFSCNGEQKSQSVDEESTTETTPVIGVNPRVHRLTHLQWANSVEALRSGCH